MNGSAFNPTEETNNWDARKLTQTPKSKQQSHDTIDQKRDNWFGVSIFAYLVEKSYGRRFKGFVEKLVRKHRKEDEKF